MKSIIKEINMSKKIIFLFFFAFMFAFSFFNSAQALHNDGCSDTSNGHNCDEWYFEGTYPNFTLVEHVTCKNNDNNLGSYLYTLGTHYRADVIRGDATPPAGWGDACSVPCTDSEACGNCECRCQGKDLYCADRFPDNRDRRVAQSCKVAEDSSKYCIPTHSINSYSVINGTCGTRSDSYSPTAVPPYAYNTSTWPSGSTWCAKGAATNTPSNFPAQGGSVAWNCAGGNVSFNGSGKDGSGNSITYKWVVRTHANNAAKNYSQDRVYDTASFSDTLPAGSYYVFFAVRNSALVWSDWIYVSITISSPASCSASRATAPLNGDCGARDAQRAGVYKSSETSYANGSTWCKSGNPANANPGWGYPGVGNTVTWNCNGTGGGTNASCSAARLKVPTLTLSANPTSVILGGTSTLTWTTANVSSCWAYGGSTGWQNWRSNTGGNWTTSALSPVGTHAYGMNCWNSAGEPTGPKVASVVVGNAPVNGQCVAPARTNYASCAAMSAGESLCEVGQEIGMTQSGTNTCNWTCPGINNGSDVPCSANLTLCGNGVINTGEGCDDGNTSNGDGCSSTCQNEAVACAPILNYSCSIQTPSCGTACNTDVSANNRCEVSDINNCSGTNYVAPSVCRSNGTSCPDTTIVTCGACPPPPPPGTNSSTTNWIEVKP